MKKISALITLLLLFIIPLPVEAKSVEVRSYLITEEQEMVGTPTLKASLFSKLLTVGYRSGKVVLSSTPDGKGTISVPDDFSVNSSYPAAESFRLSPGCPATPLPPLDITHVLWRARNIGYANLTINFSYRNCRTFINEDGVTKDYTKIGTLYLVHFDDHDPGLTPFLELPWDYKANGLSFSDAALAMSSYFDHEYPLLSTNMTEPSNTQNSIVTYKNVSSADLYYSNHDGYDWAARAKAHMGDPVLAAAAGTAKYISSCGPCGNAIHIDHGNGYQTRYYHLLPDGLITNDTTSTVNVTAGQTIGKIGYTGNVMPHGPGGAHIHFMVVQDKDNDGSFDDNIPDGLVDPFGWMSDSDDPWETYTFSYGGEQRTGSTSRYLWKNALSITHNTLTSNGGTYGVEGTKIIIPKGTVNQDVVLSIHKIPPRGTEDVSAIKSVQITIRDSLGAIITTFQKVFDVVLTFTLDDIARYKPETVAIYSSTDGSSWQKENTVVDTTKGEAKTSVNHLTDFALMGEKRDSVPPVTTASLDGDIYQMDHYISPVEITLTSTDEPATDTLGVAYLLYKVNDGEWKEYKNTIELVEQGEYELAYYAVDGDGNTETIQTLQFTIDYTPLTPTISPTPTNILLTPTRKPTPTPKSPRKNDQQRLICKFINSKKKHPWIQKFVDKKIVKQLQKLCSKQKHK